MKAKYAPAKTSNRDDEMLREIEKILDEQAPVEGQHNSFCGFCSHLASSAPHSIDEFEQQLEVRLIEKWKQQRQTSKMNLAERARELVARFAPLRSLRRGALQGAVLLILMVIGTIIVDPSAQAWAQGPLNDLLYYFNFSRTTRELPVATVFPLPSNQGGLPPNNIHVACEHGVQADTNYRVENVQISFSPLTRAQIENHLGFTVSTPTYLPAGYCGLNVFELVPQTHAAIWQAYNMQPNHLCASDVNLSQSRVSEDSPLPFSIGAAPATPLMVAGDPGLWVENLEGVPCQLHTADGRDVSLTLSNSILVWDHKGIRYRLAVDSTLGLNEVLQIAGSLQ